MALRFSLRQLEYFQAVAEHGSIAGAADEINVSSPSISAAISQLEEEFGVQVFVRKHAQGLSLTPAGTQLLAQARQVLAQARRLGTLAHEVTHEVRGPLNVGCLLTFAQIILPQLRRRFADAYPDVTFRQFEMSQTGLFEGVRNASLDVALTYDLDIPGDLRFQPLATLPPYVLVGAGHPLARARTVNARMLADHPMVLLDLPASSEYFLSLFKRTGQTPRIIERTRDIAVMQSLVGNGFGYSLANIQPAPTHSPDGKRLHSVQLSGPLRPLHMGLLHIAKAKPTLTVRTFMAQCARDIGTAHKPEKTGRRSKTPT
jgi:DNA-binding transcriptional LysR family regulator